MITEQLECGHWASVDFDIPNEDELFIVQALIDIHEMTCDQREDT